jgi:hypothetical protein
MWLRRSMPSFAAIKPTYDEFLQMLAKTINMLFMVRRKAFILTKTSHLRLPIPARLSAACNRIVHDVIKNKKICLKLQDSLLRRD